MKRLSSSGRGAHGAGITMWKAALMILFAVIGIMPAAPANQAASAHRSLVIDPSSTPVAAGTATLIIGTLGRTGNIYGGTYQMKVSPYFFKSEKGRLAIVVSEEALGKISQGQVATVIGTATTIGGAGQTRHIDAVATPTSKTQGKLKLWFMSGDRKMIFQPTYHFAEADTAAVLAPAGSLKLVSDLSPHAVEAGAIENLSPRSLLSPMEKELRFSDSQIMGALGLAGRREAILSLLGEEGERCALRFDDEPSAWHHPSRGLRGDTERNTFVGNRLQASQAPSL